MAAPLTRVGIISADGHTFPEGEYFPVDNPATGEVWAEAFECQQEHIDSVVAAAAETYRKTWRNIPPDRRGALVARWAELIREHTEEIASLEVRDAGHLLAEATGDVDKACSWLNYYAGMSDKQEGRYLQPLPDRVAYQVREPYGVVVGINPFNANLTMLAWKAGPALVAGNCFVLKAAELTPIASFRMVELALEAGFPPGVISIVTGSGHLVGPMLCQHPGVGAVVFTGGPDAGREVIRQTATNITPVALELGGKAACVLLDDVDLDDGHPVDPALQLHQERAELHGRVPGVRADVALRQGGSGAHRGRPTGQGGASARSELADEHDGEQAPKRACRRARRDCCLGGC